MSNIGVPILQVNSQKWLFWNSRHQHAFLPKGDMLNYRQRKDNKYFNVII